MIGKNEPNDESQVGGMKVEAIAIASSERMRSSDEGSVTDAVDDSNADEYELSTSDDDELSSLELEDEDFYTDDLR